MIRTRLEYDDALRNLAKLLGPFQTSDESAQIAGIANQIEEYERQHGITFPNPPDAIRYRMKQLGLSIDHMGPILGPPHVVRQVLSGAVPLTLKMIESLISRLGIPADSLVQLTKKAA